MKKIITAQQCKTMLENIFNSAIENGEGFHIFGNSQMTIGDYRVKGEVKVAILTSEKYLPQIYIDQDYDVLDEETEHVCVVSVDELLSWDRMSDTHPFAEDSVLEEDELYLFDVNNIVGKLLLLYSKFGDSIWDFTWETFLNDVNTLNEDRVCKTEITYEPHDEIGDDEEVYILCYYKDLDDKIEIEPFRNREDMISVLYTYWDGTGYVKAKWGEVKDSI